MPPRLAGLPASLLEKTQFRKLGPREIPALLAHPDWSAPRPVVIWMHGRTVSKEIDPGRYLRWIRAGVAACAVDLPGHGERAEPSMQTASGTLHVVRTMVEEIDHVVEALADPALRGMFDLNRMAIGGMSAGGMAALRRLADPHEFRCASVESTSGDFSAMRYFETFSRELVHELDPLPRVPQWRPIPLLALHSEADEWVPVGAIRTFTEALASHYASRGLNPDRVRLVTWPNTGAPYEHAGFGRVANDAKNLQTDFLREHLLGDRPS